MINNNLILKGTFKDYEISRTSLDKGSNSRGREVSVITKITMSLSIFSNGMKAIKRLGKKSLKVHRINIYTKNDIQLNDSIPFENRIYTVTSIIGTTINKCEAITNGN